MGVTGRPPTCICGCNSRKRKRNGKRRGRVDPITKAFRRIEREIMERKRQPRFGLEDELA